MEPWQLVLLGSGGTFVVLTWLLPVTRRLWAFFLYDLKWFGLWLADLVQLRRLWALVIRKPYEKLTAPVILRSLCEDLGPTFVKFAQIVASSPGLFPRRYSEEFSKCLDRVKPFPSRSLKKIFRRQFGESWFDKVREIDRKPIASASIAQVYGATLRNGGDVVIKVQRPGIERRIDADMRILRLAARFAERFVRDADLANPVAIVEDFESTLREELDFRMEAANMDEFNRIMDELGHADIHAPTVHWELTGRRVLTMERFSGTRIDDLEEVKRRNVDTEERLVHGLRAWFQSVLLYGFFHGDVHAGNLMLLDNGHLGFLDFGIVGRFDDRQRWLVTDYVVAFVSGDYRKLGETMVAMGGVSSEVNLDELAEDLRETYQTMLSKSFAEIKYDDMLPRIQKVASKHRMRLPKEFVLITKQMLYFDRYAKLLAPNLNVFNDPRLVFSLMTDIQRARQLREETIARMRAQDLAQAEAS